MYKCNIKYKGDWNKFFNSAQEQEWGGSDTIEGKTSLKILLERMIPGDFILAYQTDRQAAIGLCRLQRFIDKNGEVRMILKKIKHFKQPVKVHELKKSNTVLRNAGALKRGGMETLYEVSSREAQALLSICGLNPKQFLARLRIK